MTPPLTGRLLKAASLVGKGTQKFDKIIVSDVGCDHAYLSIYLVKNGIADFAVASDVREGPLASAKANTEKFECSEKVVTLLTNGLDGVEAYAPTDIVICGMGGETVCSILNSAAFIRKHGTRLILQPMTASAEVVLWLSDNGFRIVTERYSLDGKKPYRIISAEFDGEKHALSILDALTGILAFEEDREAYNAFCRKQGRKIEKKLFGIASSCERKELDELREAVLSRGLNSTKEKI